MYPDQKPVGSKRAAAAAPWPDLALLTYERSTCRIHRMRGHPKTRDLFHLHAMYAPACLAEHSARVRNSLIFVQIRQRFIERCAGMRNLGGLFRLEVVQFLSIGSPGCSLF